MWQKLLALLMVFWLGMQWSAGYVVAPLLFQTLPKVTAGQLAGSLFHIVSYVGLFTCALLWLSLRQQVRHRVWNLALGRVLLLLLLLLAVNEWVISPVIAAHKAQTSHWLLTLLGGSFGAWHGVSAAVYLLISLLGVWLAWRTLTVQLSQRWYDY